MDGWMDKKLPMETIDGERSAHEAEARRAGDKYIRRS